jgi:thiamine kinase-like enzyme
VEQEQLKMVGPWEDWKKEVEWIRDMAAELGSLVVFAHNDLQYGNVLRRKGDGSLMMWGGRA